ncbi:MAG: nucleoside deaminase [Candidatus Izemoplasmatales bacterium]|nr:nucleoside deaminase [Candidatus Izemoplasmatales bacterium]
MKQIDQSLEIMALAIQKARTTMTENIGGPFGAAIIDEFGDLIAVSSNSVLRDHDPTAHAEVNAIRLACKNKGTHDLSNCVLYTTCFPCPMCLSAIMWSNIKKVYYGCNAKDAAQIGFRDDFMYDFIKGDLKDIQVFDLENKNREECLVLFKEYHDKNKELY